MAKSGISFYPIVMDSGNIVGRTSAGAGPAEQITWQQAASALSPYLAATNYPTLADLKAVSASTAATVILAQTAGYYTSGDLGGGTYVYASGAAAGTYVDNGGTIIVPTGGDGSAAWLLIYETLNVRQFGAKGDALTDDTSAMQAALTAAASKSLYIPIGTYNVTTELSYAVNTLGPIDIHGDGANSIIMAAGATNKALHISDTVGQISKVSLRNFAIESNATSSCAALLHLDGLAHFFVSDMWLHGNNKADYGMRLTASQQGEVSGGQILGCTVGGYLEDNSGAGVRCNGVDWHGMTFVNITINFQVTSTSGSPGVDDLMFHHNHLTSAATQIDAYGGTLRIESNHIEPILTNDGVIIRSGRALMLHNTISLVSGSVNLTIKAAAYECLIMGNLLYNGTLLIESGSTDNRLISNFCGIATFTDSGTRTLALANYAYSGVSVPDKITLKNTGYLPLILSGPAQILGLTRGGATGYITTQSSTDESIKIQNLSGTDIAKFDKTGSCIFQHAALSTSATDGFTYIPTCAGTPTGVPTARTGTVPIVYDTTDNLLYIYNSGWKSAAFA